MKLALLPGDFESSNPSCYISELWIQLGIFYKKQNVIAVQTDVAWTSQTYVNIGIHLSSGFSPGVAMQFLIFLRALNCFLKISICPEIRYIFWMKHIQDMTVKVPGCEMLLFIYFYKNGTDGTWKWDSLSQLMNKRCDSDPFQIFYWICAYNFFPHLNGWPRKCHALCPHCLV